MGKRKAQFQIKDIIVAVICPNCDNAQNSPNWPHSHGWDRKDVRSVGSERELTCQVCRAQFPLPVQLLDLMAV